MQINTEITDGQAAALAMQYQVASYEDGNDLMAQCAAAAELRSTKQGLIAAVAMSSSKEAVDAATTAWNTATGVAIKLPPVGGGGVKVVP